MQFQVRVRVDVSRMAEFAQKLQKGELDRSLIRGETHCLKHDPAVGFSIWEADSHEEFNAKFTPWRKYYCETVVSEVITPMQAMTILFNELKNKQETQMHEPTNRTHKDLP